MLGVVSARLCAKSRKAVSKSCGFSIWGRSIVSQIFYWKRIHVFFRLRKTSNYVLWHYSAWRLFCRRRSTNWCGRMLVVCPQLFKCFCREAKLPAQILTFQTIERNCNLTSIFSFGEWAFWTKWTVKDAFYRFHFRVYFQLCYLFLHKIVSGMILHLLPTRIFDEPYN